MEGTLLEKLTGKKPDKLQDKNERVKALARFMEGIKKGNLDNITVVEAINEAFDEEEGVSFNTVIDSLDLAALVIPAFAMQGLTSRNRRNIELAINPIQFLTSLSQANETHNESMEVATVAFDSNGLVNGQAGITNLIINPGAVNLLGYVIKSIRTDNEDNNAEITVTIGTFVHQMRFATKESKYVQLNMTPRQKRAVAPIAGVPAGANFTIDVNSTFTDITDQYIVDDAATPITITGRNCTVDVALYYPSFEERLELSSMIASDNLEGLAEWLLAKVD